MMAQATARPKRSAQLAQTDPRSAPRDLCAQTSGIRSPHHRRLDYARGMRSLLLMPDLQDPPEVILDLARKWKEGYEVV